jgi:hypothetical protein
MRRTNLITHCAAVLITSFGVLMGVQVASSAPLPSSTALVKAAAPAQITAVGYVYRDGDGVLIDTALAVGFLGASAVSPFYAPPYYPAYVYPGPPVAYAPLPYYGPAIVYGRPLLAPDPYYPAFYPYVRGTRFYHHGRGY